MVRAWVKHNIEEVGLLEHFLPSLYAEERGAVSEEASARAT
jgi:hypothetical protein